MSFTSLTFLQFIVILFTVYWITRNTKAQNILLLIASYGFYGWMHPWYALLLGISTLIDYGTSLGFIQVPNHKKFWLTLSLVSNLGILGFFKYYNFFAENIANSLNLIGLSVDPFTLTILLPVGLSFYTLKKLSFIIDSYKRPPEKIPQIIDFSLYVSFFPQIAAGPIDRHQKLLPQIEKPRKWSCDHLAKAWPLLVMGLFKKVVVANSINVMASKVYNLKQPSVLLLYAGTMAFALQILTDFSGYTDLSRSVAFLFGFDTSENFRSPYLSLTPTDFWNRWHITLSHWLRDYLFFPIRRALLKRYSSASKIALILPPLVTMFVSGFWHGAGWTYIIWGIYYGVLIAFYQQLGFGGNRKPSTVPGRLFTWFIMFQLIVFGWAIFRAPRLPWLTNILLNAPLVGNQEEWIVSITVLAYTAFYATLLIIKHLIDKYHINTEIIESLYYAFMIVAIIAYTNSGSSDFIYVQF